MNYVNNCKLLKPQVFRLFLVPFDSDSDSSNGALSKIIVEVRDLEAAHSLSDVKQGTVKDIQQWFTNSEIIENRKTFLGGRKAYLSSHAK